ncbi:MAG TPA: glycoside hydrolase family 16 protein [Spirochaetota bacterium]|nr:glycoside hydrolase family 16 protein [Spirochaetota bacterium]HPM35336.1 glycoside hydrolase family 16 protein [Spirochaetota bacterium]
MFLEKRLFALWIIFAAAGFACNSNKSVNINKTNIYDKIVFEDDFISAELDKSIWSVSNQGLNWNNEDQAYTPANVSVENGKLVLTAKKELWKGLSLRVDDPGRIVSAEYTSGEVNSKLSWKYGRFESKIKIPSTKGVLSAFWMTPADGTWPPEIDITEILGHDPLTAYFTNHYGTQSSHKMNNGKFNSAVDLSKDFHIYSVEWDNDSIRWFIDGVLYFSSVKGVPSKPFIMRLSLPVGPDWEGNPDQSSVFPQRMEIDWVRVYQ